MPLVVALTYEQVGGGGGGQAGVALCQVTRARMRNLGRKTRSVENIHGHERRFIDRSRDVSQQGKRKKKKERIRFRNYTSLPSTLPTRFHCQHHFFHAARGNLDRQRQFVAHLPYLSRKTHVYSTILSRILKCTCFCCSVIRKGGKAEMYGNIYSIFTG